MPVWQNPGSVCNKWSSFQLRPYDGNKELGFQHTMFHETTIQAIMPITSSLPLYSPSNPCFQINPRQTQSCRALMCSFCVPALSHHSWLPTEPQLEYSTFKTNSEEPGWFAISAALLSMFSKSSTKSNRKELGAKSQHPITTPNHRKWAISSPIMMGQNWTTAPLSLYQMTGV